MKLKYAVIGTGACGGVIGSKLLKAGCDVHFLIRSDYEYIHSNGMEISLRGSPPSKIGHVSAYKSIDKMPKSDVILLMIKGYDNSVILPQLSAILKEGSIIMIFQNGLCIEKKIAELYPNIKQILTVSWIKATKLMPGCYRHDFGELIDAINYIGRDNTYGVEFTDLERNVVVDFANAGLKLDFLQNFFEKQWTKLTLNIPFFILTIKYDVSSDQILNNESYRKELQLLRMEIQKIATAYSIKVDEELIFRVDKQLCQSERPTYPSMKVDYDHYRKLELETIFLPLIERAKAKDANISQLVLGYNLLIDLDLKKRKNEDTIIFGQMQP